MKAFADDYLRPIGIGAMLDVPTTVGGVRDGVLCHEHVGGPRRWTEDEQTFAVAVGNLVSLTLERDGRRHLEKQFRQAQKMEAVGQLAGGVAHDFNNILTAIQFNASLMQAVDDLPAEAAECARDIEHAVQRAAGLTRQLLTFSRKQVMQMRQLDLNRVVTEVSTMLRRIIGEDIVVDVRCTTDALPIRADPGMIEQVLVNLAVNARDAMTAGGTVFIETSAATVDDTSYARLSVRDTGTGMPSEVQARVFEPFFTTKPAGRGTGLGLAMVHGIVAQHRGFIDIDSVVGRGTTFSIYVPCVRTAAIEEITQPAPEPSGAPGSGGQMILVVEDEAGVRQLISTILTRAGYRVVVAEHGVAALAQWAAHKDTIALVLTDIVMPEGMTGVDLARAIHRDAPSCPIVFTSGYAPEAATREMELTEGENFLPKPLTAARLLSVVAHVLGPR
jgi:two-component system cell cycle sensor histidine kinase/response regulator CckA